MKQSRKSSAGGMANLIQNQKMTDEIEPFTFHNTKKKVWINQDSEMDEQSILNLQKSFDSDII